MKTNFTLLLTCFLVFADSIQADKLASTELMQEKAKIEKDQEHIPLVIKDLGSGTEWEFPPKLANDDFDGEPCLITFSEDYFKKARPITRKMNYGDGSVENPIRTYAKFYFKEENSGFEYLKKTERSYDGLRNLFSLNKDYEKAIYIGCGLWPTGKLGYEEVKSFIHPDCYIIKRKENGLDNKLMFDKAIQGLKNKSLPKGEFTMLAIIRLDYDGEKILYFLCSGTSDDPDGIPFGYNSGMLLWNGEKWQYRGMDFSVNGVYLARFYGLPLKGQLNGDASIAKFDLLENIRIIHKGGKKSGN